MDVKPITLEDYKSYAKRHGIEIKISDDELQKVLDAGNRLEQEHIKAREAMKEAHRERMEKLMAKVSE